MVSAPQQSTRLANQLFPPQRPTAGPQRSTVLAQDTSGSPSPVLAALRGTSQTGPHPSTLTFSADCDVPKNIGMKANHTMQVVYMVNPMGLASLKVSGTPRVLIA